MFTFVRARVALLNLVGESGTIFFYRSVRREYCSPTILPESPVRIRPSIYLGIPSGIQLGILPEIPLCLLLRIHVES